MGKCYKARTLDSEKPVTYDGVRAIAEKCNTYPVLIHTLLTRGFSSEEIEKLYNSTDSEMIEYAKRPLKNTDLAADQIIKHLNDGNDIFIFADYDCDGITSGYVMFQSLKDAKNKLKSKSKIFLHYPQRSEGYGLNSDYCKKVLSTKKNGKLVITVDNGITRKNEVKQLKDQNVDVIITDHHEPIAELLPDCTIVNPCYNDIGRKYLAGVAVAWNVASAFLGKLDIDSRKYMPTVALGTIADVMPATFENACILYIGLKMLNSNECPKILSLMHYQDSNKLDYNAVDVAFNIAPKINAASRMGDVRLGAAGFLADDKADIYFKQLNTLNEERKKLTKKAQKAISKIKLQNDQRIVCFDGSDYGHGILGIIAGEIAKRYPNYPAFVYTVDSNNVCSGSIRNNNTQLELMSLFQMEKDNGNIISYAGHENACVISVEKDKLESFIKSFSESFDELDFSDVIEYYDGECSLAAINNNFLTEMNKFPFMPHDVPVFRINSVDILNTKISTGNKNNIKFHLADDTSSKWIWGWGLANKYKELGSPKKVHIICSPCQDFIYKSRVNATIRIIDMIPAVKTKEN